MEDITYKEVWDKLSAISVNDHIQKKGNLSYLSWAWAWQVMMENYPEMKFFFHEPTKFEDGSLQVNCTVSIRNIDRDMWLPVMDYKNKSIQNPSSRDISDAQMRCLVKCFALFGLGHYIYAGEDVPSANERTKSSEPKKEEPVELSEEKKDVHRATEDFFTEFLTECDNVDKLRGFWSENKPALKQMEKQAKERFDRVLTAFKSRQEEIKSQSASY